MKKVLVTLVVLCSLATVALAGEPGAITGKISYGGKAPAKKALPVTADVAVCGKQPIYDESILLSKDGGLANVVVAIKGLKGKTAKSDVVLDQVGCTFRPRVQAAMVGSQLALLNSDPTLHNVHSFLDEDTLFNLALPSHARGKQVLEDPGIVSIRCDAGHTWMSAHIAVFEHPFFAVTKPDGTFTIKDVPPGTYTVELWHEKLGKKSQKVQVTDKGTARLDAAF